MLAVVDKEENKQILPDIQRASSFQGKCDVLRESFFPANVITPPPMPAGFLSPRSQDLNDTFHAVFAQTVNKIIETSRMNSAVGADKISYRMIRALTNVH